MNFLPKYKWLLPMLLFTGALIIVRVIHTGYHTFLFIPWNLFLALVPLYFSFRLLKTGSKRMAWVYMAAWLLFFPNSMYIITDLFHLANRKSMPQWYDLLILFSAAIEGIVIGFLSLIDVEKFLRLHIGKRFIPLALLFVFLISGYGIYLGRYLRWNSWDIITEPADLFLDIARDIVHPFRNHQCWLLTGIFGSWMYIMYRFFKTFMKEAFLEPVKE